MEKALLIYNPTAGKESIEFLLDEMLTLLSREGFKVVPFATKGPGHASEIASQEGGNYDSIIAAGGDGTLHEVINGINLSGNPIRLGIIPGGTSNDFARALDIPRNLLKACKIIRAPNKKGGPGIMNGRRFINIAGGETLLVFHTRCPVYSKPIWARLLITQSIEELPRLRPVGWKSGHHCFVWKRKSCYFLPPTADLWADLSTWHPKPLLMTGCWT